MRSYEPAILSTWTVVLNSALHEPPKVLLVELKHVDLKNECSAKPDIGKGRIVA